MVKIRKKVMAVSAAAMLGVILSGITPSDSMIYADNLMPAGTVLESSSSENTVLLAEEKAVTNGWFTNDDGTKSYYQNGEMVTQKVIQIEGVYYYFDFYGRMLDDDSVGFYDSEAGKYRYVRARSGGKLYCNEWYEDSWGG